LFCATPFEPPTLPARAARRNAPHITHASQHPAEALARPKMPQTLHENYVKHFAFFEWCLRPVLDRVPRVPNVPPILTKHF